MVITCLNFGLGNQLFQYAMGVAIAQSRDAPLYLEISSLNQKVAGMPGRRYCLDDFEIDAQTMSWADLHVSGKTPDIMFIIKETRIGFSPNALVSLSKDCTPLVLVGSWQSEQYFKSVESILRKHLSFRRATQFNDILARTIKSVQSVSVHVRRGDYISSPLGGHLGFVGADYYRRAIKEIEKDVSTPHFFVFSDDIRWCRDNLEFTGAHTFVSRAEYVDDYAAYELYLMTCCKHFIIANSTFSWWGAWLSSYDDKVVIAPKRWFAHDGIGEAESMIPVGWLRL